MSHVTIPAGYRSTLSLYDTQEAIALIKKTFESKRECIQRQMEGSPTDTSSRGEPGHYIPVLSQRVYMKFYSKEMSGTTWIRENDGKPYQEALEALLTKFIEAAKAVSLVRGADNE